MNSNILFTIAFFLFFYLSLEIANRKIQVKPVITRKIAHIFSGIGAVLFSLFLTQIEFIICVIFFLVFIVISSSIRLLHYIHLSSGYRTGEIVYPIGLLVLALGFYNEQVLFITGVLLLALPDVVASLVGKRFNSESKSYIGSLAYQASSFLILIFTFPLHVAFLMSVILAVVEHISRRGLDNLTVPLFYTIILLLFKF